MLFLAVCAAALASAISAPAALASSRAQIRVGAVPRPAPKQKVLGALASGTKIGVTVTLQPRDPAALAGYATAVATPGSAVYHDYITPAQFAQRFGPTRTQIAAVESSLRAHGLKPRGVSANGLAIPLSATAGELSGAFSTSFERVAVPGGPTAYANTSTPAVDASVAGDVQGVLGLDTLSVPHPLALRSSAGRAAALTAPRVATGGPQPCAAASTAAPQFSAETADQIASSYRYPGFYAAGDFGAGQTVAIYELEGNFNTDINAYQTCYGTSASVTYQQVDRGPPPPSAGKHDGLESELDIEDLIGLAPKASLIVYQGPNSTSGGPGSGPYDTYNAIISQDRAQVISTSWGLCESALRSSDAKAEDTLFQEAATQGQSIVAASGDEGSEDCYDPLGNPHATGLAVDDPGSQPFVTGAGGTTLTGLGPPPSEVVWNDAHFGAGGGGVSALWPMPAYQSGAPASLRVISANSSGTPCGAAPGSDCREVPDVSADASDRSPYLMYYNGGWAGVYGTSGAAPTWAALIALANASSACGGSPIGFANPVLYRAAGSSAYASVFNDITSGDNDYLINHGGLFPAGAGYDMATALGTPIASALAAALCDRVTVGNPGSQTSAVGASVSLPVNAVSSGGGTLQYAATGLPAGLSINSSTGVVSGAPTTVGSWNVSVLATAADGVVGSASFTWNVIAAPVVTTTAPVVTTPAPVVTTAPVGITGPVSVAIVGPGNQAGTVGSWVSVPVSATDSDGGALAYKALGLPAGLSINGSSGLVSGTPRASGRSTVTVMASDAGVASAATSFSWTISAAASVSHSTLSGVAGRHARLSFTVAAASGSAPIKTIVIGLPKGLSFAANIRRLLHGIGLKGSRGKRLRFTAKPGHGAVTITLGRAATMAQVTISSEALAVTRSLALQAGRKLRSLSLIVRATNSSHATTRLGLKLNV